MRPAGRRYSRHALRYCRHILPAPPQAHKGRASSADEIAARGLARSSGRGRARLTQPYIKGKQVVVTGDTTEDYSTKKKETRYSMKSNEADSLDQVGTVVVLRYNDVPSGDYVSRSTGAIQTGYRRDCGVRIIDSSIPAVIYKKTLRGKNPGSTSPSTTTARSRATRPTWKPS